MNLLEENQFLRRKRARVIDEFEELRNYLTVHLDYWIKDERIIPIAIRIWNKDRKTLECYIYEPKQELLLEIKNYYSNRNKVPYWVSFIADTAVNFVIAMSNHFEKYDIAWIPSKSAADFILNDRYVKLYLVSNHAELIEKYYNCQITSLRYVNLETAYKIDYLLTEQGDVMTTSELNNINQAIDSVEIKIRKTLHAYPAIRDNPRWLTLATLITKSSYD